MRGNREEILTDINMLLRKLGDDWEYTSEISEATYLLRDMGFESLGVVALGSAVQEHYDQVIPFPELFAEIEQRELRDISVGERVDFIHEHLDEIPAPKDAARS